ncbi:MAG TPA: DUF3870 domain-containing protein [Limnochordales bacterium]
MVRTVFLAGHARLPQGVAAQSVYDSLALGVEIDARYHVILQADCTLATELANDFVRRLLRGYSLRDGFEPLVQAVRNEYRGAAQRALVAALKDLEQEYQRFLEAQRTETDR